MAKRAARRAKLAAIDSARIHSLVFDHTPANDRDQSYIRKIRPRSDNQRLLMEAIEAKPMTIAELLYGVKAVTTAGAQFTWVPWEFLQKKGIRPWRHMTVWQPPYGRTAGYQRRNAAKAIAKGLTFRPVAVTAKDTLDWHKTRPEKEQLATLNGEINGLAMTKEAEVLAEWKASKGT